jgi:hypothetical protein
MKIITEGVLVSAEIVESTYNDDCGCRDNCLDACTCTGNDNC